MKKIILYIGSVVFTALMVYNIGAGNLIAKSSDVSLESIKIMAAAADIEDGNGHLCPYQGQGCIIRFSDGTYETIPGKWSTQNP